METKFVFRDFHRNTNRSTLAFETCSCESFEPSLESLGAFPWSERNPKKSKASLQPFLSGLRVQCLHSSGGQVGLSQQLEPRRCERKSMEKGNLQMFCAPGCRMFFSLRRHGSQCQYVRTARLKLWHVLEMVHSHDQNSSPSLPGHLEYYYYINAACAIIGIGMYLLVTGCGRIESRVDRRGGEDQTHPSTE